MRKLYLLSLESNTKWALNIVPEWQSSAADTWSRTQAPVPAANLCCRPWECPGHSLWGSSSQTPPSPSRRSAPPNDLRGWAPGSPWCCDKIKGKEEWHFYLQLPIDENNVPVVRVVIERVGQDLVRAVRVAQVFSRTHSIHILARHCKTITKSIWKSWCWFS